VLGYDWFVSYARADGTRYAQALQQALTASGFRCFVDTAQVVAGDELQPTLRRSIRRSSKLVLVATPGAVASHWVELEVECAIRHGVPVVPIEISSSFGRPSRVRDLIADSMRLDEADPKGPTDATIGELRRSFTATRRHLWRTRALVGALLLLSSLTTTSLWFQRSAKSQHLRARDQAHMQAAQLSWGDPTVVAAILREVKQPEKTEDWQRAAVATLQQPLSLAVYGLGEQVTQIALVGDSGRIAAGTSDGEVFLVSVGSPRKPSAVCRTEHSVSALAATGNGLLAASFVDGSLCIADTEHPSTSRVVNLHSEATSLAIDGERLAAGFQGGQVELRSLTDPDDAQQVGTHGDKVLSLAFSPDSLCLASSSQDGSAKVWPIHDACTKTFEHQHPHGVPVVGFSPDGDALLAACWDGIVRLWDLTGRQEMRQLEGQGGEIHTAVFDGSGERVAAGSQDGTARVWDLTGASAPITLDGEDRAIWSVVFDDDGTHLLTGSWGGTAHWWDLRLRDPSSLAGLDLVRFPGSRSRTTSGVVDPLKLRGHEFAVWKVAVDPQSGLALTGSGDGTLRTWRVKQARWPEVLHGHRPGMIRHLVFRADGGAILAALESGQACLWRTEAPGASQFCIEHDPQGVLTAAFSADGQRLLTGGRDGVVRVWDARIGAQIAELEGAETYVLHAVFHGEAHALAVGLDGSLTLWDLLTRAPTWAWPAPRDGHAYAAADQSGSLAVIAASDEPLRLVDIGGQESFDLPAAGDVGAAAFSMDGGRFALGNWAGEVHLFSTEEPEESELLGAHSGRVSGMAFSEDGDHLASYSTDDRFAYIWDLTGDGVTRSLEHPKNVSDLGFDASGRTLFTAAEDGVVRIWDVEEEREPTEIGGHRGPATAALAPGGRVVVTGDVEGRLRLMDLASETLMAQLWRATRHCLAPEERTRMLGEKPHEASKGLERCRQMAATAGR